MSITTTDSFFMFSVSIMQNVIFVTFSVGNTALEIKVNRVLAVRKATESRINPYTLNELTEFLPIENREKKGWAYSSSNGGNSVKKAADGRIDSRFSTDTQQRPGLSFTTDMKESRKIYRIVLDTTGAAWDYPRSYEVVVSSDGKSGAHQLPAGKGTAL